MAPAPGLAVTAQHDPGAGRRQRLERGQRSLDDGGGGARDQSRSALAGVGIDHDQRVADDHGVAVGQTPCGGIASG
jgi:hypothetical protein